jgi:OOP family OmpA-OmpF porin
MKLTFLVLLLLVVAGCASSNKLTNLTYRVRSEPPGAQVYIDGMSMGVTPIEFSPDCSKVMIKQYWYGLGFTFFSSSGITVDPVGTKWEPQTKYIYPCQKRGKGKRELMFNLSLRPEVPVEEEEIRPTDSDGDGVYDDKDRCPDTPKGTIVNEVGCFVPPMVVKLVDSDGDGVYDDKDECPDTPKGTIVNEVGCFVPPKEMGPTDSDGDGVYDDKDRCPGTPKGASVNAVGCWIVKGLKFDTAKWHIEINYLSMLNELVSILEKNPLLKIEIQGHTDSRGSLALNQTLSENRAGSVMEFLVWKGIAKERLTAKGFGESKPAATNDTPEGREQNRRVELKPLR